MSGQSSSHDTYRPFMIQSGSLTEAVHASNVSRTNHQQHPHIPRKKPSRPTLPSAIMSYDDRATWWSAQEEYTHPGLPETAYSCSSHGHDFGHSPGSVAWRPVWNEEYEEALRSDAGSMFSGRFHHQDIDGEASYSEMTHASHTTSTDLLHHHAHTPSRMDDDLKQLWDVASTLLTRPPSTLSHNIDMNSVKQPERRQRVTFGWGRMGKPPSPSPSPRITTPNDKEYDPESIAQGIVECAEVGRRASTATALTWRGLLPSPRQTARGETPLPKSSTIESFSEKEESLPAPKARCRWWILALCIIVWAIGVTCIVLGVLVWKKGAKWF